MAQIDEKRIEYTNYINEHIRNVQDAFLKYGKALCIVCGIMDDGYEILKEKIVNHDLTKFSEEEFEPYRANFYPTDEEKDSDYAGYIKICFEKAWVHHFTNNDHHPEYWVRPSDRQCIPMDSLCVIEMILDWTAMGKKFNDTAYTYWHANRESKRMHPRTVELVDKLVEYVKDGL